MREILSWFDRQAARSRRLVLLEDALLGNRFPSYVWYRLRYFAARYLTASVLHTVQVLLLFKFFSMRQFQGLLLIQAAAGLAGAFWWGSLEAMRARLRFLQREQQQHRLAEEVGRWLGLALRLAALVVLASTVWFLAPAAVTFRLRAFTPADLYLAVILLRLAVDIVARCYHSGVYALRRVFRPLPAVLAAELLSFLGVLAFWPWLRVWSLPLAFCLSTLVGAFLLFRFTSRSYRQLGLPSWPAASERLWRGTVGREWREWLAAGSSFALMRLDSLLVLGLFRAGSGGGGAVRLAVLFFLLSPTIRAGFEWVQLFYFDLKRLERPLQRLFRRRFENGMDILAGVISLIFWGISAAAGVVFYGRNLGVVVILLLPFFVTRSYLAAQQMKAYAEGAYGFLLGSGAAFLAGVAVLGWLGPGETTRLAALAAVMSASAMILLLRRRKLGPGPGGRELRTFPDWLAELREVKKPVTVFAIRIHPGALGRAHGVHQLARLIAGRLGPRGAAALSGAFQVAWFETKGKRVRVTPEYVLGRAAGCLESVRSTGAKPSGLEALRAAVKAQILDLHVNRRPEGDDACITVQDVRGEFHRLAPEGIVFDPRRPGPMDMGCMSLEERVSILREASFFVSGIRRRRRPSRFQVTAFLEKGALRLVFLLTRETPFSVRRNWEKKIRQLNLEAAAGPELSGSPPAHFREGSD